MSSSVRSTFRTSLHKPPLRFGRHVTAQAFITDLRKRLAAARQTAAAFHKKAGETTNSSLRIYFANMATTYRVIAQSHESAIERVRGEQVRQTSSPL